MIVYEIHGRGVGFLVELLEIVEVSETYAIKRAETYAAYYADIFTEITVTKVVKTNVKLIKIGA